MVDVAGSGKSAKRAQDRIEKLTSELDALEVSFERSNKAFKAAIKTLSSLCPDEFGKEVREAIKAINSLMKSRRIDPMELDEAIQRLKSSLLLQTDKQNVTSRSQEISEAGKHVAMALLAGLRSGDKDFDTGLEKFISEISSCISSGNIRPAMTLVTDLMENFRSVQNEKRRAAEDALAEIYLEVVSVEEEMAGVFKSATAEWVKCGAEFDQQVTVSAGKLATCLQTGEGVDELKASVLEHVRTLRETIRSRKTLEQKMLDDAEQELSKLREDLKLATVKIDHVKEESRRLGKEALTDPMTGVLNKRAFSRYLDQLMARPDLQPVSVVVFDIDRFKRINDNYGHQAGDKALEAIAEQAGKSLRGDDVLFRYAGDEFVVVLPKTEADHAAKVAERVRKAAENISFTYRGKDEIMITVSLGLAQSRKNDTSDSLFERADQALLEAKREGRNRVKIDRTY